MGEDDFFPIVGGVAALAVLLVMIRWGHLAVAIGTISVPFMVEVLLSVRVLVLVL